MVGAVISFVHRARSQRAHLEIHDNPVERVGVRGI
jgi:hypothetical protein